MPAELFPTDIHWFPRGAGGKKQSQSELFVLTATDGKFITQILKVLPHTCMHASYIIIKKSKVYEKGSGKHMELDLTLL